MRSRLAGLVLSGTFLLLSFTGCAQGKGEGEKAVQAEGMATALFAGGCFWCMEPPFDKLEGVVSTMSGYTGGYKKDPTYEEVSAGGTGHVEAVQVIYDPDKVTYEKLLEVFWHNIDPVDAAGQFCDKGSQYRSEIFYQGKAQKHLAEQSKSALEKSGRVKGVIATNIVAASVFYPAEEYHQDFYMKNPLRYKFYRSGCGRDQRLEEIWRKRIQ
jgi:methionine-S-sulfoxide reductase